MDPMKLFGIIMIALGIFSIVNPKQAFKFRTYASRKWFGMKVNATTKTYQSFRYLGILYVIVGLLIISIY